MIQWSGLKGASSDFLRESGKWKVMQFTGLHDSAGVDIYESDVIKWSTIGGPDLTGYVISGPGRWEVQYITDDRKASLMAFHPRAEVIGNIHENPELVNSTDTDKDGD